MAITYKREDTLEKMLENFATLPDSDKAEAKDSKGKNKKKAEQSESDEAD
ncbi:SPJ_0845 family protein [Streptococcus sp. H49]